MKLYQGFIQDFERGGGGGVEGGKGGGGGKKCSFSTHPLSRSGIPAPRAVNFFFFNRFSEIDSEAF